MKSIMKKYLYIVGTTLSVLLLTNPVSAQFADDAKDGISDLNQGTTDTDIPSLLQTVVNTLLFLVGAASAITLVIAGLRFIFSQGDQQRAASARNAVYFSIVGLAVAAGAWAIIKYVLGILYS